MQNNDNKRYGDSTEVKNTLKNNTNTLPTTSGLPSALLRGGASGGVTSNEVLPTKVKQRK